MKISMILEGRSYAGTPIDIVRKMRAAAHVKGRDLDGYMRTVVERLRAEGQASIDAAGPSRDLRCEAFLAGTIREGFAIPVFHRDHLDGAAIRILRKARGLSQEKLAQLLDAAHITVNRWEGDDYLPSGSTKLDGIQRELFDHFAARVDPHSAEIPSTLELPSRKASLLAGRQRVRSGQALPLRALVR